MFGAGKVAPWAKALAMQAWHLDPRNIQRGKERTGPQGCSLTLASKWTTSAHTRYARPLHEEMTTKPLKEGTQSLAYTPHLPLHFSVPSIYPRKKANGQCIVYTFKERRGLSFKWKLKIPNEKDTERGKNSHHWTCHLEIMLLTFWCVFFYGELLQFF